MSRALHLVHGALTLLLAGGLYWQMEVTRALNARTAELEAQLGAGGAVSDAAGAAEVRGYAERRQERQAMKAAVAEAAEAARAEGMSEDEVAELVETRMEEMLDEREARQRDEATQRWIGQASESTLIEVEKVADKHGLSEQAVADAHDVVIDSLYFTIDLKQALNEGQLSVRQAKEDGDNYLVEMRAELVDILGEAATEELGMAIRPGVGWKTR